MISHMTLTPYRNDERLLELVEKPDQKTLALWAIDCASGFCPILKEPIPKIPRPRKALDTLQNEINTEEFSIAVIRKASPDTETAVTGERDRQYRHPLYLRE